MMMMFSLVMIDILNSCPHVVNLLLAPIELLVEMPTIPRPGPTRRYVSFKDQIEIRNRTAPLLAVLKSQHFTLKFPHLAMQGTVMKPQSIVQESVV